MRKVKKEALALYRLEHFVDKLVPIALVLLAVLLIIEFSPYSERFHDAIIMADRIIVTVFLFDLWFKWRHVRNLKQFVKLYWIDILAVFPFYLVFRAYALLAGFATAAEDAQKFLHETRLLSETKYARELRILREAEEGAKFVRAERFLRFLPRGLRLFEARATVTHHTLHKMHSP